MKLTHGLLFVTVLFAWSLVLFYIATNEVKMFTPTMQTVMFDEQYCLGYNFLRSQKSFREDGLEPVTLTTHGTSGIIEEIEKKSLSWDGPISFALFIDYHSKFALEYIADVHRCNQKFQEKVSVQIAFRISPYQMFCQPIQYPKPLRSCEDFIRNRNKIIKTLLSINFAEKKYRRQIDAPFQLYPFNIMRNLARKGAQSDLHLLMDADMITSDGFATKVKKISNEMIDGKNKKALVIRRFETNGKVIPRDNEKLKAGFDNNTIFEFHHKFFFVGHRIPDIQKWFNVSGKTNKVSSWEIPYLGAQWETPVIIHRDDVYNADYFPARIRDVQSLIYKLCRANYTFNLLSHVFSVHEGVKVEDTMYSKVVSEHSRKYGRNKAFTRYVKEMDDLYPHTTKRCGRFQM
ncbi:hypothetical protein GCK72_020674 [Caenorhabditis remanei]|uniref:Uncharacterized protein n=1 Tax=Caenorhabditis remanei TaxID=31234 RepID=A0A6A5GHH4_CAERE|nr:hypothetical protein GCK72_020674 [Caenorhabditis remanei]KAF1754116.1 hypothetical protein GCK72_020674 [Caenorhabditis remanei]